MLFVACDFDFIPLLILQNTLGPTLTYIPALDRRVHRDWHVIFLHCFKIPKKREEWFEVLEDEFDVDELINWLAWLRSESRNTPFNVNNCWLGLHQLTNFFHYYLDLRSIINTRFPATCFTSTSATDWRSKYRWIRYLTQPGYCRRSNVHLSCSMNIALRWTYYYIHRWFFIISCL